MNADSHCCCCQERYTCPSLSAHPLDDSFIAQTNGGYIALFSSQRPYRMNKRRRYEGHKVSATDTSGAGHVTDHVTEFSRLIGCRWRDSRCVVGSPQTEAYWSLVVLRVLCTSTTIRAHGAWRRWTLMNTRVCAPRSIPWSPPSRPRVIGQERSRYGPDPSSAKELYNYVTRIISF